MLLKHRAAGELIACIRDVRAGKRCIDEDVLSLVVHLITKPAGHHRVSLNLTRREHEVIQLVARGLRNKEIAGELSISEETVKTHLRSIFQKLPIKGRVELAVWAKENGLD